MSDAPLLITSRDIDRLHAEGHVGMADYVDAVEAAFAATGDPGTTGMPRQVLWRDGPGDPRTPSLKLSASVMRPLGVMGASIYSAHFRPGEMNMWISLFSTDDGSLLALLQGRAMSLWKTGATAAVAARHMARPDAVRVALLGTGYYARTQLLGLAAVRPLERVRCYSRDASRRAAFVERAAQELPSVRVEAADSAEVAVRGADIVVTVSTSPSPIVQGDWLAEGVHCNVMGQHDPRTREVDTEAVRRCRVVVDSLDQAWQEKGELLIPLAAGEIGHEQVLGELGEVVRGGVVPRKEPRDRTMFCSGGTALEYMGVCRLLYERARAAGLGQALDVG